MESPKGYSCSLQVCLQSQERERLEPHVASGLYLLNDEELAALAALIEKRSWKQLGQEAAKDLDPYEGFLDVTDAAKVDR